MPPLWQAERTVEPQRAKSLIEQHFPELTPVRVRLFGEGWDNIAYLVNEEFVFRFPRRTIAVPLIRAENSLLRFIAPQVPVPVPVPRFFAVADEPYGWPFLGYQRLDGVTGCAAQLTEEHRRNLARPVGEFLRALHALSVEHARSLGAEPDKIGKLDIALRLEKTKVWLSEIRERNVVSDQVLGRINAVMLDAANIVVPETTVLLHGDLYARHLLIKDGKLSGVIDWGDVSLGHPAIDLAIMFTLLPPDGRTEFESAYGEMDVATHALARFRAASHTSAVLAYACDIGDTALLNDALTSVNNLISE